MPNFITPVHSSEQEVLGFGLRSESAVERKKAIEELQKFIGFAFSIGDSRPFGDCGFDSVAQQLEGISWSDLRQMCKDYVQEYDELEDDENWIKATFLAEESLEEYEKYKANIDTPKGIWARANIDFRIISAIFQRTIHTIEVTTFYEKDDRGDYQLDEQGNKKFSVLISDVYYKNGEKFNPDEDERRKFYQDKDVIHVITYNLHTVPVIINPLASALDNSIDLLMSTIDERNPKKLKELVRQGKIVDIDARNEVDGKTALHVAASKMQNPRDFLMITALFECGANPKILDTSNKDFIEYANKAYQSSIREYFFSEDNREANRYHMLAVHYQAILTSLALYFKANLAKLDQPFNQLLPRLYLELVTAASEEKRSQLINQCIIDIRALDRLENSFNVEVMLVKLFRFANQYNSCLGHEQAEATSKMWRELLMNILGKYDLNTFYEALDFNQATDHYGFTLYNDKILYELQMLLGSFELERYHRVRDSIITNFYAISVNHTGPNGRSIAHLLPVVQLVMQKANYPLSKLDNKILGQVMSRCTPIKDLFGFTPQQYLLELKKQSTVSIKEPNVESEITLRIPPIIGEKLLNDDLEGLRNVILNCKTRFGRAFCREVIDGWTLSQVAAYMGCQKILEYALASEQRRPQTFKMDLTPLHLAILGDQVDTVISLCKDHPEYLTVTDNNGKTPIDHAANKDHRIIEVLEEAQLNYILEKSKQSSAATPV